MPELVRVKRRRYCTGDLRHRITLHLREITEPHFDEVDHGEKFTPIAYPMAGIKTINGTERFDGANVGVSLTHEIVIRFRKGITSETWIELGDGTLLDIVDTENVDEQNQFLVLACTLKGPKTTVANQT